MAMIFEVIFIFISILLASVITFFVTKTIYKQKCYSRIKNLENDLKIKLAEINKLNKQQNKFWSVISHELKNLFYSYYNSIELLNTEYDDLTDEEKHILIQTIGKSYNNTMNVINELMEWSKINRHRKNYNPEKINLFELITEAIVGLSDKLSQKNIEIEKNLEDHINVYADKLMIIFVFKNVLTNAIKYSYANKSIYVNVSEADEGVEITVKDTGVGIPDYNLSRLFDVDEIFSTEGTSFEKGIGFGLIICKDFMEINGGSISIESTENKGTIVKLLFPADKK